MAGLLAAKTPQVRKGVCKVPKGSPKSESAKHRHSKGVEPSGKAAKLKDAMDKLQEGVREAFNGDFTEYLKTIAKFHKYSARNLMLIKQQRPFATRLAGYNLWKRLGRHVKKGEKGIVILVPMRSKKNESEKTTEDGPKKEDEPRKKEDGKTNENDGQEGELWDEGDMAGDSRVFFGTGAVFDISQTEGEDLRLSPFKSEEITGDVEHFETFKDALKKASSLPISFTDLRRLGMVDGLCHFGKEILIHNGLSQAATISTMIHEMAHARLHSPDPAKAPAKEDRMRAEIEAESVAYVVGQHFGVETSTSSFGYIAGYSSGREVKELMSSLETIRSASHSMIDEIVGNFKALSGIDLGVPDLDALAAARESLDSTVAAAADANPPQPPVVAQPSANSPSAPDAQPLANFGESVNAIARTEPYGNPQENRSIPPASSFPPSFASGEAAPPSQPGSGNPANSSEGRHGLDAQRQSRVLSSGADSRKEGGIEHLPDPPASLGAMGMRAIQTQGMLPLSHSRALELFGQGIPIYKLSEGGGEEMVFEAGEILEHDGIFGVEPDEWMASPDYAESKSGIQPSAKEADLLHSVKSMYGVYQAMEGAGLETPAGKTECELVHTGFLLSGDPLSNLNRISSVCQPECGSCPDGYKGRGVSEGDVIVLQWRGKVDSFLVRGDIFERLPAFVGNEAADTRQGSIARLGEGKARSWEDISRLLEERGQINQIGEEAQKTEARPLRASFEAPASKTAAMRSAGSIEKASVLERLETGKSRGAHPRDSEKPALRRDKQKLSAELQ
jgi:hypothetical protein